MRCREVVTQVGKAQVAQIVVVKAVTPSPFARNVEHRKFFAMHQRADRHRRHMRLGVDFGNGGNPRAQHRHRIMRRKQLARQLDIGQVAADRRGSRIALDAVAR
jgi:hypothetical protein